MKTKAKILILILSLTLTMANIINIRIALPTRVNLPQAKQEIEEPNPSLPITPEYKYHYENDFDYSTYSIISGYGAGFAGGDTEWSQDPNDALKLQIAYSNIFLASPFSMSGILFVESNNAFERQNNPNLGAYIDWHIDIDVVTQYSLDVNRIDLKLLILGAGWVEDKELISIYDLSSQKGRFYIPYFDQYILSGTGTKGKVNFALMSHVHGNVAPFEPNGGITLLLSFEGLRVIQEIKPKESEAEKRTLILVHGLNLFWLTTGTLPEVESFWSTYLTAREFTNSYENIITISYYQDFMGEYVTTATPIEVIANLLAQYIMVNHASIEDNVDIVCHSMGGLVVRFMIKHYYPIIKAYYTALGRNFDIKNICTIAAPNHGVLLGLLAVILPVWGQLYQVLQISPISFFLSDLNFNEGIWPSEIPLFGLLINWFTYRGGKFKNLGIYTDSLVESDSVPLNGAKENRGIYPLEHTEMAQSDMVKTVVFNDLIKPPQLIDDIFNGGTPGIIMQIEDLMLQPNYDEPGGKTLLSITIPAEDAVDINSSTVTLHVSTNDYQMTLKVGTSDTYEVELPIADGDYSFLITAELVGQVGRLYQMSGNLKIIDDDVSPPVIQMTPGDISISDEDVVGGILVSWNISDYSGISEANVLLNGVEIRSYTNQGTITDSYLLPNEHGVYTILVWARDNDGDPEHDPSGGDWSEYSIERKITIYDDDPNPPDIQITPGDLTISVGEAEGGILVEWEISDYSGISEANVLLNGTEIRSYANQGTITDSFLLANEPGVYNFSIWAKDNDNDLSDDWLEYSTMITITIHENDTPPPAIPGYSIFILLGIFSVVIILISKKRRNYKI